MKIKAILGGLILALAGLGLIFSGCGDAKKTEPYLVGGIFSISGPASYLGEPERNSLEMVVEGVNAKGGINGHPLKLAIYDDEGDVTKARLHATKLAQDKNCLAIIGPSITPASMTVLEVTQKAKLPLISCAAAAGITASTNAIAIVISESTRQVSVFRRGAMITALDTKGQSKANNNTR